MMSHHIELLLLYANLREDNDLPNWKYFHFHADLLIVKIGKDHSRIMFTSITREREAVAKIQRHP